MPVLKNIGVLYTCKSQGLQQDIHPIKEAAIAWSGNTIDWVGHENELPDQYNFKDVYDADGKMVIPGLIDCHTHLAFGGWRADEYKMRVLGEPYIEIAKAGGGILSTMKHTREADSDELIQKCMLHLNEIKKLGITTIECKSGYGLTAEDEYKLLHVYRELDAMQPLDIISTFLGAHTIPPEFKNNRRGYIDSIIHEMIPHISEQELATFCDIFVEETAFQVSEAREILQAGIKYGLIPKLHADQLSSGGGAELAAEVGAVSADHLEYISDGGIEAIKKSGTVAVSLPLASFYLRQQPIPARRLIEAGVPVAVSTDFNPGSAPSYHLPYAMTLACILQYMSPAEVLKGSTIIAAKALQLEHSIGSLEVGKNADFAVIDSPTVNHWLYQFRTNACFSTWKDGRQIWEYKKD